MARIKIKIGQNEFEMESQNLDLDKDFDKFKEKVVSLFQGIPELKKAGNLVGSHQSQDEEVVEHKLAKPKADRGRGDFALAIENIRLMISAEFLNTPRRLHEVVKELEKSGWPLEVKRIDQALRELVRSRELVRYGTRRNYRYMKAGIRPPEDSLI